MRNESPVNSNAQEEEPKPPIIVRKDPILGVFACVPSQEAGGLRDWLIESRVAFQLDHERGTRLALPGHGTFIFGMKHAKAVRDLLSDYGLEVEVDPSTPLAENWYQPPVAGLLDLGLPREARGSAWRILDGITPEHIPELIRMALDEDLHTGPPESPVVFAPVHAWRALGRLRAEAAIVPLLGLLRRIDENDDDWVSDDLPEVFAKIGPAAIAHVADYMANPAHGQRARTAALRALARIALGHPEARDACVSHLRTQLGRFPNETEEMNAFVICELLDLDAVEVAPLMEQAFAADRVDETICGDWEDVAIDLGLKSSRERPRKPNWFTDLRDKVFERALVERTLAEMEADPDAASDSDPVPYVSPPKVGRNDPCPCGSNKKFKKCCGR